MLKECKSRTSYSIMSKNLISFYHLKNLKCLKGKYTSLERLFSILWKESRLINALWLDFLFWSSKFYSSEFSESVGKKTCLYTVAQIVFESVPTLLLPKQDQNVPYQMSRYHSLKIYDSISILFVYNISPFLLQPMCICHAMSSMLTYVHAYLFVCFKSNSTLWAVDIYWSEMRVRFVSHKTRHVYFLKK